MMRTNVPKSSEGLEFDISSRSFDSSFPAFITAGDISVDGSQVILRGKEVVKIWNRNVNGGQTVEEVLSGSQGPSKTVSLCKESVQGESIAFGKNFTPLVRHPMKIRQKKLTFRFSTTR